MLRAVVGCQNLELRDGIYVGINVQRAGFHLGSAGAFDCHRGFHLAYAERGVDAGTLRHAQNDPIRLARVESHGAYTEVVGSRRNRRKEILTVVVCSGLQRIQGAGIRQRDVGFGNYRPRVVSNCAGDRARALRE